MWASISSASISTWTWVDQSTTFGDSHFTCCFRSRATLCDLSVHHQCSRSATANLLRPGWQPCNAKLMLQLLLLAAAAAAASYRYQSALVACRRHSRVQVRGIVGNGLHRSAESSRSLHPHARLSVYYIASSGPAISPAHTSAPSPVVFMATCIAFVRTRERHAPRVYLVSSTSAAALLQPFSSIRALRLVGPREHAHWFISYRAASGHYGQPTPPSHDCCWCIFVRWRLTVVTSHPVSATGQSLNMSSTSQTFKTGSNVHRPTRMWNFVNACVWINKTWKPH